MNAGDWWFVRRGTTTVGPVSMRLLLQGIQAGKIPTGLGGKAPTNRFGGT